MDLSFQFSLMFILIPYFSHIVDMHVRLVSLDFSIRNKTTGDSGADECRLIRMTEWPG